MGNLLFSPSGRINSGDFMKGMMILAAIAAVISLTGLVSFQLSQILGYISFLLIVPLFFILIKRSHDAGRSGWMSILWFLLFVIIWFAVNGLFGAIMPSAAENELKVAMESLAQDGGSITEIFETAKEFGPDVAKQTAIRSAIAGIIGTGLSAFVINLLNKGDAHDNQFGPQT